MYAPFVDAGLWTLLLLPFLGMAFGDDDPDRELVEAVLAGDGAAYRGLVERYQSRIYSVCYGMVRNPEDARDMAQEAFVKAYQNLPKFRLEASFYTWICRIAMNVSIDHLRRQKLRNHGEFDDQVAAQDTAGVVQLSQFRSDPVKNLERKQLHAAILAALDELPEEQKQIIILREVQGLSYKEISDVMDIPEGTVMSRLFYARKKLQVALQDTRG